jgi:hypothetical protein
MPRSENILGMEKNRFFEFIQTAGLLGGGSVLLSIILFGITIWEHVKGENIASAVLGVLVIVFFCVGAFIAWLQERKKFETEALKHEQPNLKLTLHDVLTNYDPNRDITTVLMSAVIVNRGAATIAQGWIAKFQSPQIDITIGYRNLPTEEFPWPLSNGNTLILKRQEMLTVRTMQAIPKGHLVHGRIVFEFQGDRRTELANGSGVIWLGCYDFTERLTQAMFQGHSIPDLNFFPDEEVRTPPVLPLDFKQLE